MLIGRSSLLIMFSFCSYFLTAQKMHYNSFNDIAKAVRTSAQGIYVSDDNIPEDVELIPVINSDTNRPYTSSKGMVIALKANEENAIIGSVALLAGEEKSGYRFMSALDSISKGWNLQYLNAEMSGDTVVLSQMDEHSEYRGVFYTYYRYKKGRLTFLSDFYDDFIERSRREGVDLLYRGKIEEAVSIFSVITEQRYGEEIPYQVLQQAYSLGEKAKAKNQYDTICHLADVFYQCRNIDVLLDYYNKGTVDGMIDIYDKSGRKISVISKDSLVTQLELFAKGYSKNNRPADAAKVLENMAEVAPLNANTYLDLNNAYKLLNDSISATAAYKKYEELLMQK